MSIWNKHPNYGADELRILTAVAAETLVDCADDPGVTPDILRVPPRSAAAEIQTVLNERDTSIEREAIQAALENPDQASRIALFVLDQIRQVPPLADKVAEAYAARRREMFSPELLLMAGAVVILSIKVKNFKVSKGGLQASFYEANEAVKNFVTGLVKSIPKPES